MATAAMAKTQAYEVIVIGGSFAGLSAATVSYTHLTLPTILLV